MAQHKIFVEARLDWCRGHEIVRIKYPTEEAAHEAGQEALKQGIWEYYIVNGQKYEKKVSINKRLAASCAKALVAEHNQVTHYSCCVFSYQKLVENLRELGCLTNEIVNAHRPEGYGFGQDGNVQRLDYEPGGWVLTPSDTFELVGRHEIADWKAFLKPCLG